MFRTRIYLIALGVSSLWSFATMAQETTSYTLEKTNNGYVRMNNKTGEMSICLEKSDQLICKLAAEERTAYEDDIANLKTRVAKLEDTVAGMGKLPPVVRDALPSEDDFEKGLSYMERFLRRFMGIAKEFEDENKNDKPESQTPQKT